MIFDITKDLHDLWYYFDSRDPSDALKFEQTDLRQPGVF